MDIHFETSNKLAPLLTENTDDVTKCSSTNIVSANSKKFHPIKLISHFEGKRRPHICVTENCIKTFTPVTIPGNSNYASISKNGRKFLFEAIVISNELEESILIKNIELML